MFYDDLREASKMVKTYTAKMEKLEREANKDLLKFNSVLEKVGRLKLRFYEQQLTEFLEIFPEDSFSSNRSDNLKIDLEISEIKSNTSFALEYAKALTASGAGGGIAAFAAWSTVGAFGTAGTGASIATLTGVFQSNAILAALGGGTLASGGFGMVGGIAVLGLSVAIPVLAIAPFLIKSLGRKKLVEAYVFKEKVEEEEKRILVEKAKFTKLTEIGERVSESLQRNESVFNLYLRFAKTLGGGTNLHNRAQLLILEECSSIAYRYSEILQLPRIDESGNVKSPKEDLKVITLFDQYIDQLTAFRTNSEEDDLAA